MKYTEHESDQEGWTGWHAPGRGSYFMRCCDCGLVHEVQFQSVPVIKNHDPEGVEFTHGPALPPKKYRVMMRVRRDNRKTAAFRRYFRKEHL